MSVSVRAFLPLLALVALGSPCAAQAQQQYLLPGSGLVVTLPCEPTLKRISEEPVVDQVCLEVGDSLEFLLAEQHLPPADSLMYKRMRERAMVEYTTANEYWDGTSQAFRVDGRLVGEQHLFSRPTTLGSNGQQERVVHIVVGHYLITGIARGPNLDDPRVLAFVNQLTLVRPEGSIVLIPTPADPEGDAMEEFGMDTPPLCEVCE